MALAVISADWIIAILTGACSVAGLIAWLIFRRDKRLSDDATGLDQDVLAFLSAYPSRRFLVDEICGEIGHTRDEVSASLRHLLHDGKVKQAGERWCADMEPRRYKK